MNTICASSIALSTSVEKNRFRPRASATTPASPGSYTGSFERSSPFHAAMRASLMSTMVTRMSGHCGAITDMMGPPTQPAPMQQMFVMFMPANLKKYLILPCQLGGIALIKQETVDKILDAARVEEVVGDFVDLKKRGTSLIGLCPFHNEKTPSFNVSVSKGIYKCFGCGAGGDSVRFVREHEKCSYREALMYLAQKYHIEVEETERTPEQVAAQDRRESLFIVTNWAGKFFKETLWDTDDGRTIGLNYFRERGYRDDIIQKFELGYSPEGWTALYD